MMKMQKFINLFIYCAMHFLTWTGLSSIQYRAILLIAMTLTVSGAPTPAPNRTVRAAVIHEAPCYVLSSGKPVQKIPLNETIDDMVRRTEGVKISASKIIKYMKDNILRSDLQTIAERETFLENSSFTPAAAVANREQAFREHYSLLFMLVTHVEHVHKNHTIKQQPESGGSLKSQISDLEKEIYRLLCDLKIASGLTAQSVPSSDNNVSKKFKSLQISTTVNEMLRAYIVIRDVEKVMTSLRGIYIAVKDSIAG